MPDSILQVLAAVAPTVYEIIKDMEHRPNHRDEWQTVLTALQVEETHKLRIDTHKLQKDWGLGMASIERIEKEMTRQGQTLKKIEKRVRANNGNGRPAPTTK